MSTEEKIFYYKIVQVNTPFRTLHQSIVTVCELAQPICPDIESLKYLEYFIQEIDFDKIYQNPTKEESLKICNTVYYGMEHLKADIDKAILSFQNNVSKMTKERISQARIDLIQLIGNLKRRTRANVPGISLSERYVSLYQSIETKVRLFDIDYQILIAYLNETIMNNLLSSYEIIHETIIEIYPLLATSPQLQIEANNNPQTLPPPAAPSAPSNINLIDCFNKPSQYKYVMEELVKQGYCAEHTYKWIYKGKSPVSTLGALIAALENVGYIRSLSVADQINVIKNTFEKTVGERSLKEYTVIRDLSEQFNFIKPSSAIS